MFLDRDRVRAATAADAQRAALQYLKASNRTVGMFIPGEPDRAEIPQDAGRGATARRVTRATPCAPRARSSTRRRATSIRARRACTLPGGVKLVMLPKQTRGDTVNAMIRLNFGDAKSLDGLRAGRRRHGGYARCEARSNIHASSSRTSSTSCGRGSTSAAAAGSRAQPRNDSR